MQIARAGLVSRANKYLMEEPKDITTEKLSASPACIIPNPQQKVDSLFQQWLTLPDAQKFIAKELDAVDHAIGKEYQTNVQQEIQTLVDQMNELVAESSKPPGLEKFVSDVLSTSNETSSQANDSILKSIAY